MTEEDTQSDSFLAREFRRQQAEATQSTLAMRNKAQAVLDMLPEIKEDALPPSEPHSHYDKEQVRADRKIYAGIRSRVAEFIKMLTRDEENHHVHLYREGQKNARQARLLNDDLRDLHIRFSGMSFGKSVPEAQAVIRQQTAAVDKYIKEGGDPKPDAPERPMTLRDAIQAFALEYDSYREDYKGEEAGRGGR